MLEAALIGAAQAVEHHEITLYGTLVAYAKQLGRDDCAALLQQNLDEEAATDKKLTKLATNGINRRPLTAQALPSEAGARSSIAAASVPMPRSRWPRLQQFKPAAPATVRSA